MNETTINAQTLVHRLQTGVIVHNPDTSIRYANPKALELLRVSADQAMGRTAFDDQWRFLDTDNKILPIDNYPVNRVLRTNAPLTDVELGIADSSRQETTWVLCNAYPEYADGVDDAPSAVVVTFFDITRRKKHIPFEDIVTRASDAVVVTEASPIDGDGPRIVYVNSAACKLTGYSAAEMLGRTPRMFQGPDTDREQLDRIRSALEAKASVRCELKNYTRNGGPYWVEVNIGPLRNSAGEVTHYAAIERDISTAKAREADLEELSIRDPLTGLHNRRGFMELAEKAVAMARRDRLSTVVVAIDVDYFKQVNDSYGHAAGDRVLETLSALLLERMRGSDIVGRMGGEEFALMLLRNDVESAREIMEELRRTVEKRPIAIDEQTELRVTISIGLAAVQTDQEKDSLETVNAALEDADRALYAAKIAGRNQVRT